MIDTSNVYISVSRRAGNEFSLVTGLRIPNFSEARKLFVSLITQGQTIKDTEEKHFLVISKIEGHKTIGDQMIYFLCVVRRGAPNPATPYTFTIYGVLSYEEGNRLLADRRTLAEVRQYAFDQPPDPVGTFDTNNRLTDGGFILNGTAYQWEQMSKSELLRIKRSIDNDCAIIRSEIENAVANNQSVKSWRSSRNIERSRLGNISQAIQGELGLRRDIERSHNARESGQLFRQVASELLPKETFDRILDEAIRREHQTKELN